MAAIGIDIGGTNIRAALVDESGRILSYRTAASSADPAEALSRIIALVEEIGTADAEAIGIGVPGRVDAGRRTVLSGGYVDFSGHDIVTAIERRLDRPVVIENDCSMALLGEAHCGAGKNARNAVMLTIGTGIGGAVLSDGVLLRGRVSAGQLGHIIVEPGGERCLCGRRGCVETISSGTGLGRLLKEAGLAGESVSVLLARARTGDDRCVRLLTRWATPLSAAIGSLIAAFDPECVVLGGGLGQAAADALGLLLPEPSWFEAPVVPAALGDMAGVVGAAVAASRRGGSAAAGKRAVLVNGVPASGKSHVADLLARQSGWPVLRLDSVKNPFLVELGVTDRMFNRTLGKASYAAMFDILRDAPPGTTAILDAWFGFQPVGLLQQHLARAGVTVLAEVWCHAPAKTIADRYLNRAGQRPQGHPGPEYVPELVELAAKAEPLRLSPVLDLDTTAPIDMHAVHDWVTAALRQS